MNSNGSVGFVTPWKYFTRALNHPQTAAKIVQLSKVEVEYHVSRLPPCNRNFIYKQAKETRTQNTPLFDTKGTINVRNKDRRSTHSKAFLRSMNATYNFPPVLLKYFSVVADKVYIWSMVKYPFLNPAWASTIFS